LPRLQNAHFAPIKQRFCRTVFPDLPMASDKNLKDIKYFNYYKLGYYSNKYLKKKIKTINYIGDYTAELKNNKLSGKPLS